VAWVWELWKQASGCTACTLDNRGNEEDKTHSNDHTNLLAHLMHSVEELQLNIVIASTYTSAVSNRVTALLSHH